MSIVAPFEYRQDISTSSKPFFLNSLQTLEYADTVVERARKLIPVNFMTLIHPELFQRYGS